MTSWRRFLIAGSGWLAMTAPVAAQIVGSQPGMMNDEGMRVPIPKAATVDLARATVADGFTFLAAGPVFGTFRMIAPMVRAMVLSVADSGVYGSLHHLTGH